MKGKKAIRIKIISMGNAETGKSCIIKRYCEKRFISKYMATIGIDYGVTRVNILDRELKVNIFDMAGHPIFYEVRNEFYKDTQGSLLVYDVTQRETFDSLDYWMEEMKKDIGDPKQMENIVFIVCANKIDKGTRTVEESEGRLWAESKRCHYFETSAQTGEGIQEVFQVLFKGIIETLESGQRPKPFSNTLGYTREQTEAIKQLKSGQDNHERLGIQPGATRDEINKAYKKLAVLIHPDKSVAPGTEEAFKLLLTARTALLKST